MGLGIAETEGVLFAGTAWRVDTVSLELGLDRLVVRFGGFLMEILRLNHRDAEVDHLRQVTVEMLHLLIRGHRAASCGTGGKERHVPKELFHPQPSSHNAAQAIGGKAGHPRLQGRQEALQPSSFQTPLQEEGIHVLVGHDHGRFGGFLQQQRIGKRDFALVDHQGCKVLIGDGPVKNLQDE